MSCPKCGEKQYGNFCSNCGAQLEEKCQECGKMEMKIIGRKVCETKVGQAKERLLKYQEHKIGTWRFFVTLAAGMFDGLVIVACFLYTFAVYVSALPPLSLPVVGLITWEIMLPVDFSVIAFTIWLVSQNWTWQFNALDRAEEEFLRLNPQDAELLKKRE